MEECKGRVQSNGELKIHKRFLTVLAPIKGNGTKLSKRGTRCPGRRRAAQVSLANCSHPETKK